MDDDSAHAGMVSPHVCGRSDPRWWQTMIEFRPSALKESKPHEYLLRFLFGGACCVLAGLVAKRYGPEIGGLFLAFPAIFPAGASLIESHERRKKREIGKDGTNRGRMAAGSDA